MPCYTQVATFQKKNVVTSSGSIRNSTILSSVYSEVRAAAGSICSLCLSQPSAAYNESSQRLFGGSELGLMQLKRRNYPFQPSKSEFRNGCGLSFAF